MTICGGRASKQGEALNRKRPGVACLDYGIPKKKCSAGKLLLDWI